jgi:hypothetical protein
MEYAPNGYKMVIPFGWSVYFAFNVKNQHFYIHITHYLKVSVEFVEFREWSQSSPSLNTSRRT